MIMNEVSEALAGVKEKRNRFEGEQLSKAYSRYRPTCSPEIIQQIISYAREKLNRELIRAVDVGCGTGSSSRVLAPYFSEVHGIDPSTTQIKEATIYPDNAPNVFYRCGIAEELPFEDASVDLITAAISFQWFDRTTFMKEVKRVLVKDGVLAVYAPIEAIIVEDSDRQRRLDEMRDEFLEKSGQIVSYNMWNKYFRELSLTELRDTKQIAFSVKREGRLEHMMGVMKTSSAFEKYRREDPVQADVAIQQLTQKYLDVLQCTLPPEECVITIELRNYCALGRN